MAPTIRWQRWESGAYNWFGQTASDALPSMESELDAWITTVNGNASNTGRQLTKMRGYASSTGGNYAGILIRAGANGNTAYGYFRYTCLNSTTVKNVQMGDTFTDDTSNGGYGTLTGGPFDSSVSWVTSASSADWLIVTGTVDGQEYFIFGPSFGTPNTANQDGFAIIKGLHGEWVFITADGGSTVIQAYSYFNDAVSTGWDSLSRGTTANSTVTTASSSTYGRYSLSANGGGLPGLTGGRVYAASPDLYEPNAASTYYYTGYRRVLTDIDAGGQVYMLNTYFYGPTVLVDVRP